nr:hypothetical protein [Tanacetum cinerariifolium]
MQDAIGVARRGFVHQLLGHLAINRAAGGVHKQPLGAVGFRRQLAQRIKQPLVGAHTVGVVEHSRD